MEKYCTAGQAADDNMAHKHCMLDTDGYKHTVRVWNTFCLSTATTVLRTHYANTTCLVIFCSQKNHISNFDGHCKKTVGLERCSLGML